MKHISELLLKVQKQVGSVHDLQATLKMLVEKEIGPVQSIKVQHNILFVGVSGAARTHLYMKKAALLKKIKDSINKEYKDIR